MRNWLLVRRQQTTSGHPWKMEFYRVNQ